MDEITKIRDLALGIIAENFGQSTAELYRSFYDNKEGDVILASLKELLTEQFGEKKAKQIYQNIFNFKI